jgi:hypothetical protein
MKLEQTDRQRIIRAATLSGSVEERFLIEEHMKP